LSYQQPKFGLKNTNSFYDIFALLGKFFRGFS